MGNSMVKDNDVNQRVVHLSIDEIAEALDNCTFDTRYIIDLQEEEIIRLSEYMMSSERFRKFLMRLMTMKPEDMFCSQSG
jgi:hypothetical protein